MVRIFQVYLPVRTLVLIVGECLVVAASFLIAALFRLGPDAYLVLNDEHGLGKILVVSLFAILSAYYFDLYSPQNLSSDKEAYFRLLTVLGLVSLVLAAVAFVYPPFLIGPGVFTWGLLTLTVLLLLWRSLYTWFLRKPYLRENVCVLGDSPSTSAIVKAIQSRNDLGLDVTAVIQPENGDSNARHSLAEQLSACLERKKADRIIVGFADRRGVMPIRELLDLRLRGVKIEDASTLLEKISGRIEVDTLQPSMLVFAEGFRLHSSFLFLRRILSSLWALCLLLASAPLIPFILLAIRLDSAGPLLFRQVRMGRHGSHFTLYKFRTMRSDAELLSGPKWADKNDERVTRVGRFLRNSRLDEIPQLWNVLRGDMSFVGPRPERPEFVQWLAGSIPYYHIRHIVDPGITGWAQVNYPYAASLEDAKQKLQYDLYYIKHMSFALDLFIIFQTIKIVLLGRGAQ